VRPLVSGHRLTGDCRWASVGRSSLELDGDELEERLRESSQPSPQARTGPPARTACVSPFGLTDADTGVSLSRLPAGGFALSPDEIP